ncbi:5-methylcytosine restriction system specificity protein McrC [Clostridium saudiense]|uniref:5-methylcytosine restriction system specificity protein McrC n=1 Tax=Clostridium saudiense TaxID=1414720 RepID=UPI0018A9BF1E
MIIKVVEHEKIGIRHKNSYQKKHISKENAELLHKIEEIKKKRIFKWGYNTVSPQQWIGVIWLNDISIEIMPKISDNNNESNIMGSLISMLNVVYDVKIQDKIIAKLGSKESGIIEILITLFLKELDFQYNKGIYKEYIKEEKNLYSMKGKIDFNKNINKNLFSPHRFYCRYSSLSENNIINQIVKFTLIHIDKLSKNRFNKGLIKKLVYSLENVDYYKDVSKEIKNIKFNRQSERFRETINYCKMFWDGFGTSITTGKHEVESFLIDMNDLFEKYIYRTLKKIYGNKNIKYQENNKFLLTDTLNSKNKKINLKPDIILEGENGRTIIDTKWKIVDKFINPADAYQMNAYIDNIDNSREVILLFPKCKNNDRIVRDFIFNKKEDKIFKIRTVDILLAGKKEFTQEIKNILK